MTVNFMCQLDLSTRYPDIVQTKHYSGGVTVSVLWVRLIFESVDGMRQISLPSVGGYHPIN